jgi:dTDP-4-amino-4,6-dideoxygalactose transaminase
MGIRRGQELALFGGEPAFAEPLHVGRPNLGDRAAFARRVEDILDRRWLSNAGKYELAFEERVADLCGVKHCIACCNGTVALEIAARALGLTGEVIVPSFTFVATAHALQWQEITPVFADIRASDHTLDPAQIERHITPRTTGILPVHLWGRACDVDAIQEIATRRGLKVLYDAAHAFGGTHRSTPLGGQGDATVLSFHATKFINALEGGAIVTNNDELAAKIRLMKNFGFRTYDDVIHVGTNGKMNEVSAAMGFTNLEALDEIVAHNERNYREYAEALRGIPGLRHMRYEGSERFNYQYVTAEVGADCPISRDSLLEVLWAENVRARRYFYPGCHRMEPYRSLFPNSHLWLPETERAARAILVLPTGQSVDLATVQVIIGLIRAAVERGAEIEGRLRARTSAEAGA